MEKLKMNEYKKPQAATAILQREVTRKEFIAALGLGIASIMGFSTVIKMLTGKSIDTHLDHKVGMGYGSSNYGR